MAMTPEAKVKKKVAATLKQLGAYYFYPVTGGYGKSGVPDIVGCYNGKFFGIECKAGKGKTTALQDMNLRQIVEAGGIAAVVNEENLHTVADILMCKTEVEVDDRQLAFDF
jgi:Holliday junction resolvase